MISSPNAEATASSNPGSAPCIAIICSRCAVLPARSSASLRQMIARSALLTWAAAAYKSSRPLYVVAARVRSRKIVSESKECGRITCNSPSNPKGSHPWAASARTLMRSSAN